MHILETYSLISGCKIDKCLIHEESIVLPEKKYITFHPYSPKGNSKQYDHWDSVLDKLYNNKQFDYDIIQIGGSDDHKYDVNTNYLGQTTYHSLAFLIKHCSLHLGFDSLPIHLASHYDKKIVAIYSYYSSTCGPYFSSSENIKILQPDFSKIKPVFDYNDPFRLINTISSENIYLSICKLLNI